MIAAPFEMPSAVAPATTPGVVDSAAVVAVAASPTGAAAATSVSISSTTADAATVTPRSAAICRNLSTARSPRFRAASGVAQLPVVAEQDRLAVGSAEAFDQVVEDRRQLRPLRRARPGRRRFRRAHG